MLFHKQHLLNKGCFNYFSSTEYLSSFFLHSSSLLRFCCSCFFSQSSQICRLFGIISPHIAQKVIGNINITSLCKSFIKDCSHAIEFEPEVCRISSTIIEKRIRKKNTILIIIIIIYTKAYIIITCGI